MIEPFVFALDRLLGHFAHRRFFEYLLLRTLVSMSETKKWSRRNRAGRTDFE
jgi:hypothetical protein